MANQSISVSLRAPAADIFAARMQGLSEKGVERALRSTVTFVAKDYAAYKADRITQDIDRPRAFSKRAYSWDGANRSSSVIEARAYVRPKQAKYFDWLEYGGTKRRKRGSKGGPVSIKPQFQDRFGGGWGQGGFRRKWLDKTAAKLSAGAGKTSKGEYRVGTKLFSVFTLEDKLGYHGHPVTGIWMKVKLSRAQRVARRGRSGVHFGGKMNAGWKTYLVVGFLREGEYDKPNLNFRKDALSFGQSKLPRTAKRLLDREIEKASLRR